MHRPGRIWYLTVTGGTLSRTADFAAFAAATAQTAQREYGEDSEEVAAVRTAWGAVGVTNGGGAD